MISRYQLQAHFFSTRKNTPQHVVSRILQGRNVFGNYLSSTATDGITDIDIDIDIDIMIMI